MGEHVIYRGQKTKIGVFEELMYVSFEKYVNALRQGEVQQAEKSNPPLLYAVPKRQSLFRLPYPDEDNLPLGCINDDDSRGIPFPLSAATYKEISGRDAPNPVSAKLIYQKLIISSDTNKLVLGMVVDTPAGLFRASNEKAATTIRNEVEKIAINYCKSDQDHLYLKELMDRLISGYKNPLSFLKRPHKSNPLLNKTVIVPTDLTTDPYNCRGETGTVIATGKDKFGHTEVLAYFANQEIGLYQSDALLTLYPSSIIKQGLISNASMISSEEIKKMLSVIRHIRNKDYRTALLTARNDPATLFLCTTNCSAWEEMIVAKRQSQKKGLKKK